MNKTLTA